MSKVNGLERAVAAVSDSTSVGRSGTATLAKKLTQQSGGRLYVTPVNIARWIDTDSQPPLEIAYLIETLTGIPAIEVSPIACQIAAEYQQHLQEVANGTAG